MFLLLGKLKPADVFKNHHWLSSPDGLISLNAISSVCVCKISSKIVFYTFVSC
jgi:hypothetical protein